MVIGATIRASILFDGKDVRTFGVDQWCDVRQRAIAMLPQEMRLFPELTVMENIELKNRLTSHKSTAQIMDLLSRLGIDAKADVYRAAQYWPAAARGLCPVSVSAV